MLAEALEHLVAGIVSNPDDVSVKDKDLRRGRLLEVRVHPDDVGKVIGRQGRTAQSLRTVVAALAACKSGIEAAIRDQTQPKRQRSDSRMQRDFIH